MQATTKYMWGPKKSSTSPTTSKLVFAWEVVAYSSNIPTTNLLYYENIHLLGDNIEIHCVFIFLKKLGFVFQKVHQVTSFKSFLKAFWIININKRYKSFNIGNQKQVGQGLHYCCGVLPFFKNLQFRF